MAVLSCVDNKIVMFLSKTASNIAIHTDTDPSTEYEYVLRALYAAVLLLRAQHNKWSLYYTTQLLQQIHRRLFDYQRITLWCGVEILTECADCKRRAYVAATVSFAATPGPGSEVWQAAAEKMLYPRLLLFSVLVRTHLFANAASPHMVICYVLRLVCMLEIKLCCVHVFLVPKLL